MVTKCYNSSVDGLLVATATTGYYHSRACHLYVKVGGSERTRLEMDVIWVALLYALGVVFLFRVMKRDRTVPDVVYEGLSVIAALLIVIAVLLYYIYEKL